MSEFEDRLKKAIDRGHVRQRENAQRKQAAEMTEEECKRIHQAYQLELSEVIENCVKRLPDYFPGFQYELIYGERGWGAGCRRDDLRLNKGVRAELFSRIELMVRPYSSLHVLDLAGRATIRNQEVFNRNYFEKLDEVNLEKFKQLIETWVLEFGEMYAAKT
jgi:hypothetical protein